MKVASQIKVRVFIIGFLVVLSLITSIFKVEAVRYSPPNQPAPPGTPPPPGSGDFPPALVPGDAGVPRPAPTGIAQSPPLLGTNFPHQPLTVRTRANLQGGQQPQPAWPTVWVMGQPMTRRIQTPLGENLQIVPRKIIEGDEAGPRWRTNHQLWFQHENENAPIPTVKVFCRILVIAGAVFATVFMIFAAFSVVLGHRDAGQRVIATAAGLILLFMGYSIYKIIMINAYRFGTDETVVIERRPVYQREQPRMANTPDTPAAPAPGAPRSNLPVVPFHNAVNP